MIIAIFILQVDMKFAIPWQDYIVQAIRIDISYKI
jgi:hypothetical protein